MGKGITFVGVDTAKNSHDVAMLLPGSEKAVEWKVNNEAREIKRMVKKVKRQAPGDVRFCYEAGPCGYDLQRQIRKLGMKCVVIAPSLTPVKPGERIKTNRRDARKLAELDRAGLLTEVHPPTEEEESVRDLCRCRAAARKDLHRCRHRLGKMLLRRGIIWTGRSNWGAGHRKWLRSLSFEREAERIVFEDYLLAVEQLEERIRGLDQALEAFAEKEPYREPVGWLRCFRGIDTITAMTVVAELHDFRRFRSARELMCYLGLVPSENSTGDDPSRGGITKAGNSHVRRVLVEASWHYRHAPRIGVAKRKRREGQPKEVLAIADKAAQRLNRRFRRLAARGKHSNKIATAVSRELVGFIWSVLHPNRIQTTRSASPQGGENGRTKESNVRA
ncbi:MAG: IS110 family transposase [Paracoccaceae bacterium]